MLDDLKIRNKLILLVAGPIVIIVILAALGARSRQASAADSRTVERQVVLAGANSDVVDALQQESISSTAFVGADRAQWKKEMAAARTTTDEAMGRAREQLSSETGTSAGLRSASGLALQAADKLAYIRQAVDDGYRWDQVVSTYSSIGNTFLSVNAAMASSMEDPVAAEQLRTASALASYKASLAEQGALLTGAAQKGTMAPDAVTLLNDSVKSETSQSAIFTSIADKATKQDVLNALASDAHLTLEGSRTGAEAAGALAEEGEGAQVKIDGEAIAAATTTLVEDLHEVEGGVFGQLLSASQDSRSDAERAAQLFLVAAMLGILGAAGAAVLLGRRITQPLTRLTAAADTLSTVQMPRLIESLKNPSEDELGFQIGSMRPIEITSTDEIGRLAQSFNEVQRVAGEVAAEQAALLRKGIGEMFVNLARRNQALLDRQIEFIDELERGEEDPDQLENLYRLDHLATRMRRNAESLLVLAGAEPPRRRGRPAPLANVVRAALAEVEDFGRIELLSFDEVLVASNAAADLAHLLSELMENATNFSPPETRVEVVGHRTKADGYVISITDHGIGMSGDQILEANESLAKPPLVGLAMSRSLGFIVVGRLATRHGIAVRMMPSASGGVTAVVSIAPSLVVDTPGGVTTPLAPAEVPARLKPIIESSGSGPLEFTPHVISSEDSSPLPDAATLAPVAWDAALADLTATTPIEAGPGPEEPLTVPLSAFLDPAPAPTAGPDLPEALSFEPPQPPSMGNGAQAPDRNATPTRPFFLEDALPPRAFGSDAPPAAPAPPAVPAAEPPRLFGGPSPVPAAPAPASPASPAAPEPLPSAESDPAPASPRLFGGGPKPSPAGPPTEAPNGADGSPPAAPLATRRPTTTTSPPIPPRIPGASPAEARPLAVRTPRSAGAPAAPPEAPAAQEPPAEPAAPATTGAGLAKRVPRSAGGSRAIPGAEVERNVGATRRSPEEIRKMLSQHSAGRQRARVEEPVPAGAPEEREAHE